MVMLFENIAFSIHCFTFSIVILCPNLMTVQTSKWKVPHTYKELIRRIMTSEYEKLLLLKSPQN